MVDETQKSLKLKCGAWCTMPKDYELSQAEELELDRITRSVAELCERSVHTVFLNQARDAGFLELHSLNFVFDKKDLE